MQGANLSVNEEGWGEEKRAEAKSVGGEFLRWRRRWKQKLGTFYILIETERGEAIFDWCWSDGSDWSLPPSLKMAQFLRVFFLSRAAKFAFGFALRTMMMMGRAERLLYIWLPPPNTLTPEEARATKKWWRRGSRSPEGLLSTPYLRLRLHSICHVTSVRDERGAFQLDRAKFPKEEAASRQKKRIYNAFTR